MVGRLRHCTIGAPLEKPKGAADAPLVFIPLMARW
jgi:hypothetical protein